MQKIKDIPLLVKPVRGRKAGTNFYFHPCEDCNGRTYVYIEHKKKKCSSCNGCGIILVVTIPFPYVSLKD